MIRYLPYCSIYQLSCGTGRRVSYVLLRLSYSPMRRSSDKADATAARQTAGTEKHLSDWEVLCRFRHYIWPKIDPPSKDGKENLPSSSTSSSTTLYQNQAVQLRWRIGAAFAFLLLGKLLNVQVPFVFKSLLDSLHTIQEHNSNHLLFIASESSPTSPAAVPSSLTADFYGIAPLHWIGILGLAYLSARAGSVIFNELRNFLFSKVTETCNRLVSLQVYDRLLHFDHRFYSVTPLGTLMRTLDRATRGMRFLFSSLLLNLIPTLFELGLVMGLMSWQFGWQYGGLVACTMATYAGWTLGITKWRLKFRKGMNQAENKLTNTLNDALMHQELVKIYGREAYEKRLYEDCLKGVELYSQKTTSSLALLNAGQGIVFTTALTACLYMSAIQTAQGLFTIGDIVMMNGLLFQLSLPLNFLGSVYREFRQSLLDIKSQMKLADTQSFLPENSEKRLNLKDRHQGASIQFENVWFRYPNASSWTLRGLSFHINPGERIAFVGRSGCGKSTLARLLYRFYDLPEQPTLGESSVGESHGRISIDDQDCRKVSLASLRGNLGLVSQHVPFFQQRSILDNLLYSSPDATMEQVVCACKRAQIHEYIASLPQGYNSLLGSQHESNLSGGERQRLALARFLLEGKPIGILDEATSSLDYSVESLIMSQFLKSGGKAYPMHYKQADDKRDDDFTLLIIAHRLTSIVQVDRIYVLDQGQVVQVGSHLELLKDIHGLYSQLWHSQQQHQINPS